MFCDARNGRHLGKYNFVLSSVMYEYSAMQELNRVLATSSTLHESKGNKKAQMAS